tara:strand:+ start:192 stop:977 length:786 start_codon:yes stop_codon:yes gene_type:complete
MIDYLLLMFVGFIAGIINIVAGGGSLLTLPMLIFLGLPPNIANGTNRIAIIIQNIFAVKGFQSKGVNTYPFSIYIAIPATIGAIIGAFAGVKIEGELFNKILGIIMLVIVAYMVFKPKNNTKNTLERITGKYFWLSMLAFFFIGLYGGFIQAGVGFIILLLLSSINQFSLVKSNAVKVTVALIYSLAAVAVFAYNDSINWKYGLILSLGNAAGGWVMSRWSVDKGDEFVKKVLIIMVLAMAIKLWFPDFYSILALQILDLF